MSVFCYDILAIFLNNFLFEGFFFLTVSFIYDVILQYKDWVIIGAFSLLAFLSNNIFANVGVQNIDFLFVFLQKI